LERDNPGGMDVQTLRAPIPALGAAATGIAPWLVPAAFRVNWVFLQDGAGRRTAPLVAAEAYAFDGLMSRLRAVRPDVGARFPGDRSQLHGRRLESIMDEVRRAFAADPSLGADLLGSGEDRAPGMQALIAIYQRDAAFRANRIYLNYYGPPRTVTTVPYQDVLGGGSDGAGDGSGDGTSEATAVAGKAVFIGYSARRQPGQRDDHAYVYTTDGFNLSGVELGATAFANLLHGTNLRRPPYSARAALVVLWGLIIAACFRRLRVRPGVAVGILLFAGYLSAAQLAFRLDNIWLPIAVPFVQFLLAGTLSVRVKQLAERAQLGIGTSEEAVLALTGRGKQEKIDHRVILFADEQGSKKRLRRALAELDLPQRRALQRDLALARDVAVTTHGGRINHTLADSMLAHWVVRDLNDAADVADQMNAACRAALAIHERVGALNRKYPGFGLAVRIGLDWGEISSRLNPSPEIKDWKMEGTPIHAAERLESLNKALGTSTLISHAVAAELAANEFRCVELGTFVFCDDTGDIVVDPLRVHELRPTGVATENQVRCAASFDEALDCLRRRDWQTASQRFEKLASGAGRHSELASRYVGWCRQTLRESDSGWTGVIAVTFSDKSQYLDRFL
jgi:adenylate cyclase